MPDTLSKLNARKYYQSSSLKMALFFTALLVFSAAMIFISNYLFSNRLAETSTRNILELKIENIVRGNQDATYPYIILSPQGRKIAGNLSSPPVAPVNASSDYFFYSDDMGKSYAAKVYYFSDGRKLFVAHDTSHQISSLRGIRWLGFATIILMAIVVATSFLISTFVVSRTNRIAQTAKEIMDTGDLSRRITIDSSWDDLGHMAIVLNSLLARVEQLMQGIRLVSDNIAHDLRTPLTRLRNNLERLKQQDGNDLHDSLIREADHLLLTFNALLRIARIETGKQKSQFSYIDLSQIVHDVGELYEPLAEEKLLILKAGIQDGVTYYGDKDLLFQAFANLLDNAIKFTPRHGKIRMTLSEENTRPIFRIMDTGPGVPDTEFNKIFERFYRGESSRTTSGNGLGLSLVGAVIELHNGSIRLENLNPGLKIEISL